jgi:uncharacterized hydantoinase/oxoprolinase family protein
MGKDVTVVTAFFPLAKSKHSVEKYKEWIESFCKGQFQCVVYTTGEYVDFFRSRRDFRDTRVIETRLEELEVWNQVWQTMWQNTHAVDSEKEYHSPELYAVWAAKQELVARTIGENPFAS